MLSNEYLAGLIDGEGCITILKRPDGRFRPDLIITNTSTVLMNRLEVDVGGKAYRKAAHPGWKQGWGWTVVGGEAMRLIREVRPHLVIKSQQADVVLSVSRFYEPPTSKRRWAETEYAEAAAAYAAIRELNRRGKTN